MDLIKKELKDMKVYHGVYVFDVACLRKDLTINVPLPDKFAKILQQKYKKRKCHPVEFTYATYSDGDSHWHAISIVHKRDHFNRKMGYTIAVGRLRRYVWRGYANTPYFVAFNAPGWSE